MRRSILLVSALALLMGATAAGADPRRVDLIDESPSYTGSDTNLPIGVGVSKAQVIAHAYTMPAVQTAIQTMLARGYVPDASFNDAAINYNPPFTAVCLAFEKPGLVLPPQNIGGPMVVVGTTLDIDGLPHTSVSGGLVIVDTLTATFFTADSLPSLAQTDGSFDVLTGGFGDPGDGLKRWNGPHYPENWQKRLNRLIRCFYLGSIGLLHRHIRNPPRGTPQMITAQIIAEHLLLAAACAASVLT